MTTIERLQAAHRDAELAYRRALKSGAVHHPGVTNAYAEGLAEALAIVEGGDVVDVRARVRSELDRVENDGLTGAAAARAALRAHAFDVV